MLDIPAAEAQRRAAAVGRRGLKKRAGSRTTKSPCGSPVPNGLKPSSWPSKSPPLEQLAYSIRTRPFDHQFRLLAAPRQVEQTSWTLTARKFIYQGDRASAKADLRPRGPPTSRVSAAWR